MNQDRWEKRVENSRRKNEILCAYLFESLTAVTFYGEDTIKKPFTKRTFKAYSKCCEINKKKAQKLFRTRLYTFGRCFFLSLTK